MQHSHSAEPLSRAARLGSVPACGSTGELPAWWAGVLAVAVALTVFSGSARLQGLPILLVWFRSARYSQGRCGACGWQQIGDDTRKGMQHGVERTAAALAPPPSQKAKVVKGIQRAPLRRKWACRQG